MERTDNYSEEAKQAALKLLAANTEMLHSFPEDSAHCSYCAKWREHIRFDEECPALLRAAMLLIKEQEKSRCAQLCINEYARWKNADFDIYGIAVGAIGAASNILCAIDGIPTVADQVVHNNESKTEETQ